MSGSTAQRPSVSVASTAVCICTTITAATLLLLASFGKDGAPQPITGKVSQETLASIVGTTRSRISFFMNKFRRLGFIEYNGHLEVHSSHLTVLLRDD